MNLLSLMKSTVLKIDSRMIQRSHNCVILQRANSTEQNKTEQSSPVDHRPKHH